MAAPSFKQISPPVARFTPPSFTIKIVDTERGCKDLSNAVKRRAFFDPSDFPSDLG